MTQEERDALVEDMIAEARQDLERATTREAQQQAWIEFKTLHRMRSPEQVRRMELARGLIL